MRSRPARFALAALVALLVFSAVAAAEVVQQGGVRITLKGKVMPHALPRKGVAPISVTLGGQIATADGSEPPQLQSIEIALNRSGKLDYRGLPACRYHQIQPASTGEAIEACEDSIVGEGTFRAAVALPEQSPFPSQGKIVAFNGKVHGEQVLFAHIFGTRPLPQSSTIIFRFGHAAGAFGLTMTAQLPQVAAEWGHVSGVEMTLGREFRYQGRSRSYLSAGCPAPSGFTVATAPFARMSFAFEGGQVLQGTMVRSCKVAKTK